MTDGSLIRAREVIQKVILPQIDRESLVTQIAIEVGAEIIEGIIKPGQDLNSVDLARRYNTSRTPIREALMLLEKESLVEIPPRKRPRAKIEDLKTVREIYRTRAVLFAFIAKQVAQRASFLEIERLEQQLEIMSDAYRREDLASYLWGLIDFHDLNCSASNNATAKRIIDSLLLRTITLRRWSLSRPGRMARSFDDHTRLVQAYRERNELLASAILFSNNINALSRIELEYFGVAAETQITASEYVSL